MKLLTSFTIHVKLFPGTDVQSVISDMCELANRTGVGIDCVHNDITIIVFPNTDPVDLVAEYNKVSNSNSKNKLAIIQYRV